MNGNSLTISADNWDISPRIRETIRREIGRWQRSHTRAGSCTVHIDHDVAAFDITMTTSIPDEHPVVVKAQGRTLGDVLSRLTKQTSGRLRELRDQRLRKRGNLPRREPLPAYNERGVHDVVEDYADRREEIMES